MGEMPFPSTAPVCETKLADTIEKIQENSHDEKKSWGTLRGFKKSKTVETKNTEGNVHGAGMTSWKCKYRQDYLFIHTNLILVETVKICIFLLLKSFQMC